MSSGAPIYYYWDTGYAHAQVYQDNHTYKITLFVNLLTSINSASIILQLVEKIYPFFTIFYIVTNNASVYTRCGILLHDIIL